MAKPAARVCTSSRRKAARLVMVRADSPSSTIRALIPSSGWPRNPPDQALLGCSTVNRAPDTHPLDNRNRAFGFAFRHDSHDSVREQWRATRGSDRSHPLASVFGEAKPIVGLQLPHPSFPCQADCPEEASPMTSIPAKSQPRESPGCTLDAGDFEFASMRPGARGTESRVCPRVGLPLQRGVEAIASPPKRSSRPVKYQGT